MVSRYVRGIDVAGSIPVTQTNMVNVVKMVYTPDCGSGIRNGCGGSTPLIHPNKNTNITLSWAVSKRTRLQVRFLCKVGTARHCTIEFDSLSAHYGGLAEKD